MPFSDTLSIGPVSLICEYDGGQGFLYVGCLSKDVRARWPMGMTATSLNCAASSPSRLGEVPEGAFRTKCFVRGLVRAADAQEWGTVEWIVPRLPEEFAMFTDNLTSAVLETGVVDAIRYVIPTTDNAKAARPMHRVAAVNCVCRGHVDAAKFLCTRFNDSSLRHNVTLAACLEGQTSLIQWSAEQLFSLNFPREASRALLYKGSVRELEWLKAEGHVSRYMDQFVLYAALGGHIEAVDWVLDSFPGARARFDEEEICLMVCTKGLVGVLEHLVARRRFRLNASDCIRFAKKGSGVAGWLSNQFQS